MLSVGWAYLPSILTSPSQAYLDGVVVDWESMRGTSATYAGQFDQGRPRPTRSGTG